MYERPRPVLKPLIATPTVLSGAVPFTPWTMAPIEKPALPVPMDETPQAHDFDVEADRQQQLELEIQSLREQARQEGYAQGHAEGLAHGSEEGKVQGYAQGYANGQEQASVVQQKACLQLQTLLTSVQRDIVDLQENIGDALIKMGTRIASHILSVEIREPRESLLAVLSQILSAHNDSKSEIICYLNSADLKLVRDNMPALQAPSAVSLVAASELSRGDVKIKTQYGDIDATLKTRWEAAMASIGLTGPAPTGSQP